MTAEELDTSVPNLGENFTGKVFSRLTILSFAGRDRRRKKSNKVWLCRCACGVEKLILQRAFVGGDTLSCGCLGKELRSLGNKLRDHSASAKHHPLYKKWRRMMARCERRTSKDWQWYGGLGVKVCDRWRNDFFNFAADMEPTWARGLTIERKDPHGDYTPDNCIWATRLQQNRNKRNSKRFEYGGISLTLGEWGEKTGIKRMTLINRIMTLGWSVERTLTTPTDVRFRERRHNPVL